jgi:glucose/arabinose dehydrogenase
MSRAPVRIMTSIVLATLALGAHDAQAQAKPACDPDNAGLTLQDGFCALLVADSLGAVRHFVVMPNGDILANVAGSRRGGPGGAIGLRDADGDGRMDVKQPLGTPGGNGIFVRGEYVYVSPDDAVLRYRLRPGQLELAGGPDTLVMGLPTGGHTAKTTVVTDDGSMFVNIGSRTNVCDAPGGGGGGRRGGRPSPDPCTELEGRAGIWRFDANRLRQQQSDGVRWATGVRNANGMTLHPVTGQLYAVVHGRDALFQNWPQLGYTAEDGAEKPSEVFIEVNQGDNHGWPYCYHDRFLNRLVLAPEYGGDSREAGRCASMTQPLVGFPGHWAPNGLVFYDGTQFPASYRGGVFVAFHGSWNRSPLPQDGFNVVFQPMADGRPSGEFVVFADGFQEMEPRGRPVGVAVGPDGSLYVSDDSGGRIMRILRR